MSAQIEDFELPDLPEGWAETAMGAVARVVGGGTPDSKDPANFCESGGYAWLTPADLSNNSSMYVSRGKRNLTDQGLRTSSAKLMRSGSVLMSSRAPIGYVAVAANPISTNQGFKSFVCAEGLQPEFVAYWLRYIRPLLEQMGSGTTFSEISGSRAKEIPLHFAPAEEQKRIVAKVDALTARVDAARARLANAPAILKRFRQSVLAGACSGRLTADWRDSHSGLKTALELLRHFSATRNGPQKRTRAVNTGRCPGVGDDPAQHVELPETWCRTTVGEVAELVTDGDHNPPPRVGSGVPHLTAKHVKNWRVILDGCTFVSESDYQRTRSRYDAQAGDVLITCVGTVGSTAIVPPALSFSADRNLAAVRMPKALIMSEFAQYILNAPVWVRYISGASGSSAQPHLYLGDLRLMPIPLAPVEEQREIVRRVEALFKLADTIEKRVAAATARAEKLTQSILAKTFRGELVPTEAELAKREGRHYEPASRLLERILAEKFVIPSEPSGARRGKRSRANESARCVKDKRGDEESTRSDGRFFFLGK